MHPGTVVILREPSRAEALARLLTTRGYPICIRPVTRTCDLRHPSHESWIARLQAAQCVVFSSLNGVEAFVRLLGGEGQARDLLKSKTLGVLGGEALGRLESLGLTPRVTERHGGALELGRRLSAALPPATRVLYPAASVPLPRLGNLLQENGHPFDHLPCYETLPIPLVERIPLDWRTVGAVVVAAPSAVAAVAEEPDLPAGLSFVAIGPTTATALRRHAMNPSAIAETPAPEGVCAAVEQVMVQRMADRRPGGAYG